ncbi:DUF1380 domain-containing protein [Candidatus Woesearchaeota archaeon]|nr:DUF1380 domain-containing protein [Candidatus Woesearchaeota archaeon]
MTKKDLIKKLEALPIDWPVACLILEPADIYDIACEMNMGISGKDARIVLDKLNKVDLVTGINRSVIETTIISMCEHKEDCHGF